MRAIADDAEILSRLQSIHKLQVPLESPVETTVTAAGEVDDAELTFAKAGFIADRFVLVGSGLGQCAYEIESIPSGSEPIPLKVPLFFAHAIGERVAMMENIHLGYIEEASATLGGSSTQASVGAANANGKIWTGDPEMGDLSVSWAQRASSLENILSAYGINEGRVVGNGSPGDPYRALVHPDTIGEQRDYAYLLKGRLKNNSILNVLFLNPTPTVSINTALGAKSAPATWQVGCLYTHKAVWIS